MLLRGAISSTLRYRNNSADNAYLCVDGATPRYAASHDKNTVTSKEPMSLVCFQLMRPYEAIYPIDIGLLGAYAVMLVPNTLTHLIKQAHRFEWRPFSRFAGFDWVFCAVHKTVL